MEVALGSLVFSPSPQWSLAVKVILVSRIPRQAAARAAVEQEQVQEEEQQEQQEQQKQAAVEEWSSCRSTALSARAASGV